MQEGVQQSASTVVITDLNGTIQYVNPRFVQLTGYSAAEAIGENPRILQSGKTPVEDNGVGISADQLPRIFEPFYRIASTSDRPGTGIGLATCDKIVKAHGGEIWAESELGKGTTLFFTLPRYPAEADV